jgi:uncharacterized membrane protein HdeD (DUF308 family)
MRAVLKKAWLSLLFHGALNLLLGVLLCILQGLTVSSIAQLLGVFAFASGLVLLMGAFNGRHTDENWWFPLQSGLLQVVLAIVFFTSGDSTGLRVLSMIGICAIVIGISCIVAMLRLREELMNESALLISGAVSILFGCWMVFFPGEGLIDRKFHLGAYFFSYGLAIIYLSYEIWKLGRDMNTRIKDFEQEVDMKEYE